MMQRLSTQFAALSLAAFLTLAMLGGVDHLATSEPSEQLVAHVVAPKASAART